MSDSNGQALVLRARNVSHQYPAAAGATPLVTLKDVDLDIRSGELMALIGPSGCGKTTLLNMFGSLVTPTSGQVELAGQQIRAPQPKKIAFVFQEHALLPWNTILDNVKLSLKFQGNETAEIDDRANRALDAVGLGGFKNAFPRQLSGGMRQRASLARALSLETDIILMDEPFAALDEQTRIVLGEDLSNLIATLGRTIVFVTHSLGEAVMLADRIAVFSARPGMIKTIVEVNEPHPRRADFAMTEKFEGLRHQLFSLLQDEIRRSMDDAVHMRAAGARG